MSHPVHIREPLFAAMKDIKGRMDKANEKRHDGLS